MFKSRDLTEELFSDSRYALDAIYRDFQYADACSDSNLTAVGFEDLHYWFICADAVDAHIAEAVRLKIGLNG